MNAEIVDERSPQPRYRRHKGLLGAIERLLLMCIPVVGVVTMLDVFLYFGKSVWVEQYLAVFLGIIMTLVPLLVPATKTSPRDRVPWFDVALSIIGFIIGFYVVIFYPAIVTTSGLTPLDRTILGATAILFILECCRRLLGWALVVIVALFILYAHFSYLMPGPLYGSGVPWVRLANYLYLDPGALFGLPVRITGTIVLAFIFFGRMFFSAGGGKFLSDGAISLMGRFRGGAAKSAVVASSAFGTISGSAVANVVTTGFFTIPLMKRFGYSPHFAAAVEATASTGGQIMPPVMGVTAFLMAELLGIPYAKVALAALMPALIYYFGVFMQVDLEAGKRGLSGLPSETLPTLKKVMHEGWIFLIPVAVLIYTLFVLFFDPDIAGLYSLVSVFIVSMFKKASRLNLKKILDVLESTGEALIELGIIVGAAGLIVGVMAVSGLGFSFSLAITKLAGGNFFLLLVLAAVGAIILGMGMPVLAAYVLVVLLVAPALTQIGMAPLAAHMFVFYFAVLSFLTPPICLSVYAASSIASAKPMPTALHAVRLGIAAYIVPFVFAFSPSLLLIGSPAKVVTAIILAMLGILVLSTGLEGYLLRDLRWFERILAVASGFGLMMPSWLGRGAGASIVLVLLLRQWLAGRLVQSRTVRKK
jgi:TRAP transporter 4TM/12TM fusion protein